MLEVDAAMGTLTIPIWAAGALSAVFLALVVLAIGRAGVATSVNVLFRVAIVAMAVSAGWLYIQRLERQEQATELRLFYERSAALLARAVAPGSALSCLDELAGETVEAACEKAVFASPEAVAAAVGYVTAKLALLADRKDRRLDPTFASGLAPLLPALEIDRFGIVAHVLAERHGCSAATCDALSWFVDRNRVVANLRDHTFDEQVAKFAASWNGASRAAADGAAAVPSRAGMDGAGPSRAVTDGATAGSSYPGPALTVSPRYDFPSSQSIPPVNIMAPEPAVRPGAPSNGQAATSSGDGNPHTATAPVPPRRPPQGRPRPAHPAAPVAVGTAPTDGAATRPAGSTQPQ